MKHDVICDTPHRVRVWLSRRNLLALLAKLDGYPQESSCTLVKDGLAVTAEEDKDHYNGVKGGKMHPETEKKIKELQNA